MSACARFIDSHEEDIVQTLRELVAVETTNPYSGDRNPAGEAGGQEVLREMLEELNSDSC